MYDEIKYMLIALEETHTTCKVTDLHLQNLELTFRHIKTNLR